MATPLRCLRPKQTFAATAPKVPPVRMLHITGAQNQPSTYLAFQNRVAELGRSKNETTTNTATSRPFNTRRALQHQNDSSPMDLCHFPQREVPSLDGDLPRAPLIPLLPHSSRPATEHLVHGEAVHDPAVNTEPRVITTSQGEGIEEGRVAVMGEAEGGAGADGGGVLGQNEAKGELRQVWDGFVEDLLGVRRGDLVA